VTNLGIEKNRFNESAKNALDGNNLFSVNDLTLPLKTPYFFYQSMINEYANSGNLILEIGAGMGENTGFLLATGAQVCATDISEDSLSVLGRRFHTDRLTTKVADMERLPFEDNSFDMVVNAGSLSYGDNNTVLNEIYRALKPGGVFIAIDSLDHNPIYRLNRYVHYLRGHRGLSTLQRMPTLKLLKKYQLKFGKIEIKFFGSISYLVPLMNRIFGERMSAKISDRIDRMVSVKRSAFKFVMIVEKK
jgi:ubiquinone/menaquinone biosynthesis C-methylase UbiE